MECDDKCGVCGEKFASSPEAQRERLLGWAFNLPPADLKLLREVLVAYRVKRGSEPACLTCAQRLLALAKSGGAEQ